MGFISDKEEEVNVALKGGYEVLVVEDKEGNEHEIFVKAIEKSTNLRQLYSRAVNLQSSDKMYQAGEVILRTLYVGGQGEGFLEQKNSANYNLAALACNQLLSFGKANFRNG